MKFFFHAIEGREKRITFWWGLFLVPAVALALCSCSKDSAPVAIEMYSGNDQIGLVDAELEYPFVVKVTDEQGKGVEGWEVTFRVVEGGGSFKGEESWVEKTLSNGLASRALVLGDDAGINMVEVTGIGRGDDSLRNSPIIFTANGRLGANVKFQSQGDSISVGDVLMLEVLVELLEDTPLGSYGFTLKYDKDTVNIEDILEGATLEFNIVPDFNRLTFDSGSTNFTAVSEGISSPTGIVSVAKVRLKGMGEGSSPIIIEVFDLSDTSDLVIPVEEVEKISINVYAKASEQASVQVNSPPEPQVVEEAFPVMLTVAAPTSIALGSYSFTFNYDPMVVEVNGVTILTEFRDPPAIVINNNEGRVTLNVTVDTWPTLEEVEVVKIDMKAVGFGTKSPLNLSVVSLIDDNSNPIEIKEVINGQITVMGQESFPIIKISSPSENLALNSTFVSYVNVYLSEATVLGAYLFSVAYDPAIINVESISGGVSPEFINLTANPLNDANDRGEFRFMGVNLNLSSPTGTINVAKITFKAQKSGSTTDLVLSVHDLVDSSEELITVGADNIINGTITVE